MQRELKNEQHCRRRHIPVAAQDFALVAQRAFLEIERNFYRLEHFCAPGMANKLRRLQLRRPYEATYRCRQFLLDESRQRAGQHHPEADGIYHPAHNVERAWPGVFGRSPDAQTGFGRLGAQHRRGGPISEQRRGDYIGFRPPIDAAGERAQLDHDHEDNLTRLGACKSGAERQALDATGTATSEDGHAHNCWPESHLRTNARFNAGGRDAR